MTQLLTRKELAEKLRVSIAGLETLIHRRDPIPYVRVGRRYLFDLDRVMEHLWAQTERDSGDKRA